MAVGIARPSCTSAVRGSWSGILSLCLVVFLVASVALAQGPVRKNVLMISIMGQSHPGPVIVTNLILSALHSDPRFQVEFYWEDLDAVYHPEEWQEQLDSIVQQYRHRKLDLIVLLGPDAIRILAEPKTIFPNVPVVFCCTVPGMTDQIRFQLPIDGLVVSIGARENGGGCAGFATGNPPPLRGRGAIRL